MNDFTKEELEMIRYSFHETIVRNDPWGNPCLLSMHRTLKDKIQSMIDNYCEHERKFKGSIDGIQDICLMCDKDKNDNQ
jgi:hypothetical protein